MAVQLQDVRLLRRPAFRRLLESRVLGHTAQNATLYALFILVVKENGSSFDSAVLLAALTVPTIVFGVPAGLIVDLLPRRLTLTLGYLARLGIAILVTREADSLTAIYLLAAANSCAGMFLGPAESATVPAVVEPPQLASANSWMILSQIVSQVLGMVVLAPLLIKQVSMDSVFIVTAVLFAGAACITGVLGRGFTARRPPALAEPARAVREATRLLAFNRSAYLATVYLTAAGLLSKVLVVLLPNFTRDVLDIAVEDTVFVAAPAAIGAGAGILLAPPLCRLGAVRVAAAAFALFLLGLLALGFVADLRDFIRANLDLGISFVEREVGVSSVIPVTMILAIPIGLAYTVNSVASRVVLNEETPQRFQGRTFAIQSVLADVVSLGPVLAIGALADVAGAGITLIASTVFVMLLSVYLTVLRRPQGQQHPDGVEGDR